MTTADQARIAALLDTRAYAELDALMFELHARYHDRPLDHVRVHRAWLRVHLSRRRYLHALGHAFAGFVVAAPASLVQRYTGLVVPAFDATKRGSRAARGPSS
jgi:hypothetical protein